MVMVQYIRTLRDCLLVRLANRGQLPYESVLACPVLNVGGFLRYGFANYVDPSSKTNLYPAA